MLKKSTPCKQFEQPHPNNSTFKLTNTYLTFHKELHRVIVDINMQLLGLTIFSLPSSLYKCLFWPQPLTSIVDFTLKACLFEHLANWNCFQLLLVAFNCFQLLNTKCNRFWLFTTVHNHLQLLPTASYFFQLMSAIHTRPRTHTHTHVCVFMCACIHTHTHTHTHTHIYI